MEGELASICAKSINIKKQIGPIKNTLTDLKKSVTVYIYKKLETFGCRRLTFLLYGHLGELFVVG